MKKNVMGGFKPLFSRGRTGFYDKGGCNLVQVPGVVGGDNNVRQFVDFQLLIRGWREPSP